MIQNKLNRFLQICLDIAEWVDNKGDADKVWYGNDMIKDIGLGYRALTGYLRTGVTEVISLQSKYHTAVEKYNLELVRREEQADFLQEVFADREPYTINDKDKERIRSFCESIFKEWDERENADD